MKYKTDRIKSTGQTVVEVKDKDFYLISIDKPHTMHTSNKALRVIQHGKGHYSIETGTSLINVFFSSKAFNVKRTAEKLNRFNLEQESRILDTLLEAAGQFNVDYEKRQLSKLARGNEYRNWREFYQDAELLQWQN